MTQPPAIFANYMLRPSELAAVLALPVEARQPCIWSGAPARGGKVDDRPAGRHGSRTAR